MKLVFFRTPKAKQFDYKPRYYDKEKDEREQRRRELGYTDSHDPSEQLRARLKRNWRHERENKRKRTSELRTVIYLMIAAFFIYLILFTDTVQNFVSFFVR